MRKEGVLQAEIELVVPFFDVDMMEVVWHGHYVKYFEEARCALLDKLGHNYRQMRDLLDHLGPPDFLDFPAALEEPQWAAWSAAAKT